MNSTGGETVAAVPVAGFFGRWDTTVWLCLRVVIARVIAAVPTMIFINSLTSIMVRLGWVAPAAAASAPRPLDVYTASGLAFRALLLAAPFVWVWPIGRYVDTEDEGRRSRALRRFFGINRLFIALGAVSVAWGVAQLLWYRLAGTGTSDPAASVLFLEVFAAYYSVYFTLLILEPMLFRDLARALYTGDALFEPKRGPMLSVRTKLFLLVVNLIVIPMALVGVSLRLGLNGYTEGLGVAILTAVCAVGYMEMLYHGIASPLSELNAKMARVAGGDFSAKTAVLADDEIGRLKSHFNEMVDGLAERERLKDTFGRFVSVEIAKRLIESKTVVLGGESIEATVLFSDIRDFTPLSESLSPQELISFLNDYFAAVTEPIAEHHGVVNKFIGDAVMALFAPQFGSQDHAADALAAALAMRRKLASFNGGRGGPPVRFGIGVHTGPLVAGNVGTERRMEYTVIGDTVNIAARIESATKDLACDLLVSESVYERIGEAARAGIRAERCEGVRVKGKDAPLVLFKVEERAAS